MDIRFTHQPTEAEFRGDLEAVYDALTAKAYHKRRWRAWASFVASVLMVGGYVAHLTDGSLSLGGALFLGLALGLSGRAIALLMLATNRDSVIAAQLADYRSCPNFLAPRVIRLQDEGIGVDTELHCAYIAYRAFTEARVVGGRVLLCMGLDAVALHVRPHVTPEQYGEFLARLEVEGLLAGTPR